jgi:voltage-gated sodium channel
MRKQVSDFLDSNFGRRLILSIILLNALLVGVNTYSQPGSGLDAILSDVDKVILGIFTVEIVLRLFAAGSLKKYLSDPWNLFDVVVVSACYIPSLGAIMSVARTLRVLRTLRAVAVFPTLRRIVGALLRSIPGMGYVLLLLTILVYVYAVIGTSIFGEAVPEYFGTLHRTGLTLFQVVTLEGWNDLLYTVMEKFPYGWIYFVTFIFLGTFTLFNLFVGVIVSNLEHVSSGQSEEEQRDKVEAEQIRLILDEVRSLRRQIERLPAG